jgi:sugar/nucleoside kinase (ribokinase family)
MAEPPGAVVVGDVITDIIVQPEGALRHGSDRRAKIRLVPGGSGASQAAWLAHEGVATTFLGRVGAADHAAFTAELAARGVSARLAADPDLPSGMLVSLIAPDGERSFFTDRGANEALARADLPDDALDGAALLHVSGYALVAPGPRAAAVDFMNVARRRNMLVTVDPSSTGFLADVGPQNFLDWTRGATMCFPNAEEAALLAGTADEDEQFRVLGGYYDLVVIKRGSRGAEARRQAGRWHAAAPQVAAIDTTGAGDAFLAGFLAAHLQGGDIPACLERGVRAGSAATTVLGGRP